MYIYIFGKEKERRLLCLLNHDLCLTLIVFILDSQTKLREKLLTLNKGLIRGRRMVNSSLIQSKVADNPQFSHDLGKMLIFFQIKVIIMG